MNPEKLKAEAASDPSSMRSAVARALAADTIDPALAGLFGVLCDKLEAQAELLIKLREKVRELDHRTTGSIRVGGGRR